MKRGDKVICVQAPDFEGNPFSPEEGVVYEVTHVSGYSVDISRPDGKISSGWDLSRFRFVTEAETPAQGPMYYRNDSAARKERPLYRGCLRYFPAALALVSVLSKKGNDKHNPGEEMHHARGKSTDHGDCILRHQADVGTIDADMDLDHAVEVAWRALAQLQELAEKQYGWPVAPGAKVPEQTPEELPSR